MTTAAQIHATADAELAALKAELTALIQAGQEMVDAINAEPDPRLQQIRAWRAGVDTERLHLAKSQYAGLVAEIEARRAFALLELGV